MMRGATRRGDYDPRHRSMGTIVMLLRVLLLLQGWLATGHLVWRERLVQDEIHNTRKMGLYEANGIISLRTEASLSHLHPWTGIAVDVVAYCPADVFDVLPILKFLIANRLYFADPMEDRSIWIRHPNGVLPPHHIVSLYVEREVIALLDDRTQSMAEFLTHDDDGALTPADVETCIAQFQLFSSTIVRVLEDLLLRTNTSSACGSRYDLPAPLKQELNAAIQRRPSLQVVAVWIRNYLDFTLNAYLVHPVYCTQDEFLRKFDRLDIVATGTSSLAEEKKEKEKKKVDSKANADILVVADLTIPVHLPLSDCLLAIRDFPSFRDKTIHDHGYYCFMKTRDLYPLPENVAEDHYKETIARYEGGCSHTTMAWYCLSESADYFDGAASDCFLSPSYMHQYVELFVAAGLPLSPVVRQRAKQQESSSSSSSLSSSSSSLSSSSTPPPHMPRLLNVGLGGGAVPNFMATYYPDWSTTTVEIDATIVRLYEEYFGGRDILCATSTLTESSDGSDWFLVRVVGGDDERLCKSQIVLADAFAYMKYLAHDTRARDLEEGRGEEPSRRTRHDEAQRKKKDDDNDDDEETCRVLDEDDENGNGNGNGDGSTNRRTAPSSSTFDVIFMDVFDSRISHWSTEAFEGISNMPLDATIVPALPDIYRLLRRGHGLLCLHLHKDGQVPSFLVESLVPHFGRDQIVILESGAELLLVAGREVFDEVDYPHPCTNQTGFAADLRSFHPAAISSARYSSSSSSFFSSYPAHFGLAHQYDLDCSALDRWSRRLVGEQGDDEWSSHEPAHEDAEEFVIDEPLPPDDEYMDDDLDFSIERTV